MRLTARRRKELLEVAQKVRSTIAYYVKHQSLYKDGLDAWDHNNLHCGCGIASRFLAEALQEQLGLPAEVVVGEYGGESHAWVKVHGIIIDLTLKQFSLKLPEVLLEKSPPWFKPQMQGLPTETRRLFAGWSRGQYPSVKRMRRLKKILKEIESKQAA